MFSLLSKRLIVALITGAILGIVCIIGANFRSDTTLALDYLFSFWYNRLLMGLVIGLAGGISSTKLRFLRGIAFGFLISFAFYSATSFADPTGFMAGIVYGVIIEFTAEKFGTVSQNRP